MIAEMEAEKNVSVIEAIGFGRGNGGCLDAPFPELCLREGNFRSSQEILIEARIQGVLS